MANRYWNPSANANWGDTNVWAETATGDPTGIATPTLNDDVFFTSSNSYKCTVGATANCKSLDFTGGTGFVGEFDGSSALNIYGNLKFSTGMTNSYTGGITYKATSGTVVITTNGKEIKGNTFFDGSGGTFQLGYDYTISGNKGFKLTNGTFSANSKTVSYTGTLADISGNFTGSSALYDLTLNGPTLFTIASNIEVSNNLTFTGPSVTSRLFVTSDTKGTARTITCNGTLTASNVDFQDITGAGSASWDLSAITGGSGNCGGNSGMTLTTATTTDCSAGTAWKTATWSVRVPLPQDTATFSGSSRTITQNMPRIGSVDFTGSSGLTWTTSTICAVFGSINLTDLATLTTSTQAYTFEGRNYNSMPAGGWTITSAGKTWAKPITFNCIDGTYKLLDNLDSGNTRTLTQTSGTLTTNNNNITIGFFDIRGTLNPGSSILESTGDGNSAFTGSTINTGTFTLKFSGTLTADRTISLASKTYYNIWNATSGAYALIIAGSNTFNDFKIDAGRIQKFANSTTQTVNTLTALGTSGSHITISNTSSTTRALLAKAGGGCIQNCDFIDIQYIQGSPTSTWYLGKNSTDSGITCVNVYLKDTPNLLTIF